MSYSLEDTWTGFPFDDTHSTGRKKCNQDTIKSISSPPLVRWLQIAVDGLPPLLHLFLLSSTSFTAETKINWIRNLSTGLDSWLGLIAALNDYDWVLWGGLPTTTTTSTTISSSSNYSSAANHQEARERQQQLFFCDHKPKWSSDRKARSL